MAALSSIRSKGKLIAICVGGALLAFVLGDFINSTSTIFGAAKTKIGNINGNSIDFQAFNNRVQEREQFLKLVSNGNLDAEATEQAREYCWEQLVRENTIIKFAEEQGLYVTDAELAARIQLGLVTPTMRQAFSNPQTGAFDPNMVTMFMRQAEAMAIEKKDGRNQFIWQTLEQELRESRQYSKYVNMLSYGLYITSAEIEKEFAQRTQLADIKYVAVPLTDVKDEEVTVTDADLKKVYDENVNRFERFQETRDIAYVSFDVIPTKEDSAAKMEIINGLKDGLANAEASEVANFVNAKSDIPYMDVHYSKGDISNSVVDSLMFAEQPGFVYGPYVERDYYKMARLIGTEMLSDSVKVSHILIGLRDAEDTLSAKNKADSLLGVYKSGISFEALAMEYSDDSNAKRDSGNLDWITEQTPLPAEFRDACFNSEKGKVSIVKVPYGYHIIKVTDKTAPKRKASVGFVQVEIRPSSQTRQVVYSQASEFAGLNNTTAKFEEAVVAQNLTRRESSNLTANQRGVIGIDNSREIIRWAFDDDKCGNVYENEYGDRFIVAAVTAIHPKGIPSLASMKASLTSEAVRAKKAEILAGKIGNAASVDAVAAQMGKNVQEAHSINFEMDQIPGIGFEPAVIATVATLGQNQVSAPIKGYNGVYVVQPTTVTPAQAIQPLNITTDRTQLENQLHYRAIYQLPQAITKMVKVEDKRVNFY